MKLASWRPYKHDQSDVILLISEQKKRGCPVTVDTIINCFVELYGDIAKLKVSTDQLAGLIDQSDDHLARITEIKEGENAQLLRTAMQNHEKQISEDNIESILEEIKRRKK